MSGSRRVLSRVPNCELVEYEGDGVFLEMDGHHSDGSYVTLSTRIDRASLEHLLAAYPEDAA